MKTIAIAAALFAALATTAAAETRYVGTALVTEQNNCAYDHIGSNYVSQVYPYGVPGNQPFAGLTMISQTSATGYHLGQAMFRRSFLPVQGHIVDRSGESFDASIRFLLTTPAVINGRSSALTVEGEIRNFANDPGRKGKACTVTFKGAYLKVVSD